MCVSRRPHRWADRLRIQDEVTAEVGEGLLSIGQTKDWIELSVIYDDGSLQARLDERYGLGLIRVQSALHRLR